MEIPVNFTADSRRSTELRIHTCLLFVQDCINIMPARSKNALQKAKVLRQKQHQPQKLTEATDFVTIFVYQVTVKRDGTIS